MSSPAASGRQSIDYERHGHGYARRRRPDPTIAARIHAALGDTRTVVVEQRAIRSLEADLTSGAWDVRHGHLRSEAGYDGLLVLVISQP